MSQFHRRHNTNSEPPTKRPESHCQENQHRGGWCSYHKVRVGLPVISAPVVLRDGHGVACRRFPHLKEQPEGYGDLGEPSSDASRCALWPKVPKP